MPPIVRMTKLRESGLDFVASVGKVVVEHIHGRDSPKV